MRVKTNVKAGGTLLTDWTPNPETRSITMRVKTNVKAGGTLLSDWTDRTAPGKPLSVEGPANCVIAGNGHWRGTRSSQARIATPFAVLGLVNRSSIPSGQRQAGTTSARYFGSLFAATIAAALSPVTSLRQARHGGLTPDSLDDCELGPSQARHGQRRQEPAGSAVTTG